MQKIILVFFFLHIIFYCFAQDNKDTIILSSCEKNLWLDKKHHFKLVNTILKCNDTLIYQMEFFNNANKVVFIQPINLAIQGDYDELTKAITLTYEYDPPSDGQKDIALMLFPTQKVKRFYWVRERKDFYYLEGDEWKITGIGANFSFFEYPYHIPIIQFLNGLYLEGSFQHWHDSTAIRQEYILQICPIEK